LRAHDKLVKVSYGLLLPVPYINYPGISSQKGGEDMATYNPKQLLNDYANGRMTPEMAVGHSLQHINLLYEAQTNANAERSALRLELNQLQAAFHRLQQAVEGQQPPAGAAPITPRKPKPAKPQ
jgi:hypothetical protein